MGEIGHVFVAWGGNRRLAEAVVRSLKKMGRKAVLGGDEQIANQSSYLGERVRVQIISAAAAIILVENSAKGKTTLKKTNPPEFRPNLMFEWGFALATLPRELVSPALIAVKREHLPSDLVGMWAPDFKQYDPHDDSSVDACAQDIANRFHDHLSKSSCNLPTTPFETIQKWRETETYLRNLISDKRAILKEHFQLVAPNLVIPAVYDGSRLALQQIIQNKLTDENPPEVSLVKRILEYYEACEKERRNHLDTKNFAISFKASCDAKFASPWARGMALNFRGVVERKISEQQSGRKKQIALGASREFLTEADKAFVSAHTKCDDDEHSIKLWRGFVCFNLAKTYAYFKTTAEENKYDDLLFQANEIRREVYNSVESMSNVSDRIVAEFLYEWLTSEIALIRRSKKPDDRLIDNVLSTVRGHLTNNNRSIGRLLGEFSEYCQQFNSTALKSEINNLTNVLSRR